MKINRYDIYNLLTKGIFMHNLQDSGPLHNIDLLYDVFLYDNESIFFVIDGIKNITASKLSHIYGDYAHYNLPEGLKTIDQLLDMIDKKSEICEIRGIKEYTDEIRRELNSDQTKIVLYLPLIINNKKHYLEMKTYRFFDKKKTVLMLSPIDVKKVNLETLYFESYKDSLTGLFNYNTCMFHLNKTYGNHYFGFIDLDNFKSINDTYGHKKGDEVLALIGKKLIEIADQHVIMYRKSGDEFLFMTIDLDYDKTMELVNKIQTVIRNIHLPALRVDCSIGLVEYKDHNPIYTVFDALILADIAMYMSKNDGRGRVTFMDEKDIKATIEFGPLEETLNHLKSKHR